MDHAGDDTATRRPRRDTGDILASERHRERERMLEAAHRERRIPRYRSLVMHWAGRWARRPRPMAPAPLPEVAPGQVSISFGGHATALVRYASLTILCDPMLGRWVRGVKRATAPGLSAEALAQVDLVLITHGHVDHLHRGTLARLPRTATIVVPPRTAHRVSDLGFARVVEIEVGQSIQDRGVDIATAAVRHGDSDDVRALSYVIRGDGPSVYFCGDSGYFSGFADIGERLQPDIALLPIGGYYPLSFRERHMSPLDALYALEDLRSRVMIPIHHGAFALSYERLDEPRRWLAELVKERRLEDFVIELAPGESRVFVPPRGQRRERTPDATPGVHGDPDAAGPGSSAAPGASDDDLEWDLAEALEAITGAAPGAIAGAPIGTAGDARAGAAPVDALAPAQPQALPVLRAVTRIRESKLHQTGAPAWVTALDRAASWILPAALSASSPPWAQALSAPIDDELPIDVVLEHRPVCLTGDEPVGALEDAAAVV